MNVFVRIPHDRHANRALLTARDRLINTTLTDNKANALRKKDINKQILTRICFEVEKETNSIQCNIIKLSLAISNKRHKTVDYWLYCKKAKNKYNIPRCKERPCALSVELRGRHQMVQLIVNKDF